MILASNYPGQNFWTFGPTIAALILLAPMLTWGAIHVVQKVKRDPAAVIRAITNAVPYVITALAIAGAVLLFVSVMAFYDSYSGPQ